MVRFETLLAGKKVIQLLDREIVRMLREPESWRGDQWDASPAGDALGLLVASPSLPVPAW